MPGINLIRNNNGYRYYNACYTASATNDSNANQVFNDNFNGLINGTMLRTGVGIYSFESSSPLFVQNLSSLFFTPVYKTGDFIPYFVSWEFVNSQQFLFRFYRTTTGVLTDLNFTLNLEYRLYYNYIYSTYP